jgi:hypothetical protein
MWRGRKKVETIKEMIYNSPVVGALRLSYEMPVRDIDWFFTGPDEETSDDDPGLQLLNDSLAGMSRSWREHIVESMLFPFYGWSMFTITYKQEDGRWLWKKLKMLGHDTIHRWLYNDDKSLKGLQQLPHLWPDPIPIERMLVYRFRTTKDDPEGESILRPAYQAYYYVKSIQTIEGIGLERNLAGLPMLIPPHNADMSEGSADRTQAEKIIRNIRMDEQAGILIPPPSGPEDHQKWSLELLSGGYSSGTRTLNTDSIISRYEKRILMSAHAQFLMLGMDNVGAMSTMEGGTDFHAMALNAAADIIAETFTQYAIPRLFELNGLDPKGYKLQHSPAGTLELMDFAMILDKIGSMITWTPEDEMQLRSVLRMPEKTIEELEAIRAAERERALEEKMLVTPGTIANTGGGRPPNMQPPEAPPMNTMGAEYFEAGEITDKERLELEEKVRQAALKYFRGAEKRIAEEAKGVIT